MPAINFFDLRIVPKLCHVQQVSESKLLQRLNGMEL